MGTNKNDRELLVRSNRKVYGVKVCVENEGKDECKS